MSRVAAMMAHAGAGRIGSMPGSRGGTQPVAAPNPAGPIDALTALRFLAALLVVIFHHGQAQFASAPGWVQNVVRSGFIGVPFFFILSGFILAYNYLPQVERRVFDPRQFWLARFARIYPLHAAALFFSAPLALLELLRFQPWELAAGQFVFQGAACFGLVQAWIPGWSFAWNGPAWSLSVEAFFYLLFPLLATRLSGRGRVLMLLLLAAGGAMVVAANRFAPSLNLIPRLQSLLGWANPLLWLPLFLLGMCAAEWHLKREAATGTIRGGRRAGMLTVMTMALLLGALTANWQRHSQLLFCYGLAAPCAALILLLADRANRVGRWLAKPSLLRLGEASFALYILHRPLAEWWLWLRGGDQAATFETAAGLIGYLVCATALSLGALRHLELPCRAWIKNRSLAGRDPARALSPARSSITLLP